ncbi:MAG: PLxRFG domain-containing protein [Geobacteraceae bacterium]|nr:PLxRFG domain-containing protein [Geobacteraceae bacterium]
MGGIYTLSDIRDSAPAELKGLSDNELLHHYAASVGMDPLEVAHKVGYGAGKGTMGDMGRSLKAGIQQLPGIATGLADIPVALATGYRPFSAAADALGEATGFQPGKWAKDTGYSDQYNRSQADVQQAWQDPNTSGLDVAKAYLRNPMYTVNQTIESAPAMLAGGAISKGLGLIGRAAGVAGGAGDVAAAIARPGVIARTVGENWASPVLGGMGEGLTQAGQAMDDYQGDDARKGAIAALGSGTVDMLIAAGGGRLAHKFGLETPETAMAGGKPTGVESQASRARRVLGGMAVEGGVQEFPQSMQEQAWQNYADGKDIGDGVLRAGIEGGLAGAAMGGAFNFRKQSLPVAPSAPPANLLQLGLSNHRPNDIVTFPDGSSMLRSEYEATFGDKAQGGAGPSNVADMKRQAALQGMIDRKEITPEEAVKYGYVTNPAFSTSQGFEDLTKPQQPGYVAPLQDTAPNWSTSAGANGSGESGVDFDHQALGEQQPNTGVNPRGRGLQMPVVPGRPGLDDVMQVGPAADVGKTGPGGPNGPAFAPAGGGNVATNGELAQPDLGLQLAMERAKTVQAEQQKKDQEKREAQAKHDALVKSTHETLFTQDELATVSQPKVSHPVLRATVEMNEAKASGLITETQHTSLVGELRSALASNDKERISGAVKNVNVTIKDAKKLAEAKAAEAETTKNDPPKPVTAKVVETKPAAAAPAAAPTATTKADAGSETAGKGTESKPAAAPVAAKTGTDAVPAKPAAETKPAAAPVVTTKPKKEKASTTESAPKPKVSTLVNKLQGKTAVLGKSIDFKALKLLLEPLDARMHHAIRLTLGVDEQGNRIPPLSDQAAAEKVGLAKPGKSNTEVSRVRNAIGISREVKNRFLASPDVTVEDLAEGDIGHDRVAPEDNVEAHNAEPTEGVPEDEAALSSDDIDHENAANNEFSENRKLVNSVGGSNADVAAPKPQRLEDHPIYKGISGKYKGDFRKATAHELGYLGYLAAAYNGLAHNDNAVGKIMEAVRYHMDAGPDATPETRAAIRTFAKESQQAYDRAEIVERKKAQDAEAKAAAAKAVTEGGTGSASKANVEDSGRSGAEQRSAGGDTPGGGTATGGATETQVTPAAEAVQSVVSELPDEQVEALEAHYGAERSDPRFIDRVTQDVIAFVNKGAQAVSAAIREAIKAVANGVLAVGVIMNPMQYKAHFDFNVPQAVTTITTQTRALRAEVPAEARAKMSDAAVQVYEAVAPAAMKTGKGFMIADKPNGMLHVFNADGTVRVQSAALFGKDKGDTLSSKASLEGGAKITPAGTFHLRAVEDHEYTGGKILHLVETTQKTARGTANIAVHSVWLGDQSEHRSDRLKSDTAADNKISFGCINTTEDAFVNNVIPEIDKFNGGMMFVLPDEVSKTGELFKEATETQTTEATTTRSGNINDGTDRDMVGKQEDTAPGSAKFSKASGGVTGNTVAAVKAVFNNWFPVVARGPLRGVARFYQSEADALAANPHISAADIAGAKGFVDPKNPRVMHLIADNIPKGKELAVFLHELGVHIGLANQFGANLPVLIGTVKAWANAPKGSLERRVFDEAKRRMEAAGTISAHADEELLAYAAEVAAEEGVEPDDRAAHGTVQYWLSKLAKVFSDIVRSRFGGVKLPAMTAQHLVNLAYGAANIEVTNGARELGTKLNATDKEIADYYAKSEKRTGQVGAKISNRDDSKPGTETLTWGPDETYGNFLGITTRADSRYDDGNNGIGEGLNAITVGLYSDGIGQAIQTVTAWQNKDGNWGVAIDGPRYGSTAFQYLKKEGMASEAPTSSRFNRYTRLEGIPAAATNRLLSEVRRRLTRALGGVVPHINSVRETGANPGKDGSFSPDVLATKFSKAVPAAVEASDTVTAAYDHVRAMLPPKVKDNWATVTDFITRLSPKMLTNEQLKEQFGDKLKTLGQYIGFQQMMRKARMAAAMEYHNVSVKWDKLPKAIKKGLDAVMMDATMQQIHPDEKFTPGVHGTPNSHLEAADKAKYDTLKAKYDAMTPEAKTVYQEAKAQLAKSWADRGAAYNALVDNTYRKMFEKANEQAEEAKTQAEKEAALERIAKIQKDRDDAVAEYKKQLEKMKGPYFPLVRFGSYLVIGESQKLKDLKDKIKDATGEERGKLEDELEELRKSGQHYRVSAHENKGEANAAKREYDAAGLESRFDMTDQHIDGMRGTSQDTLSAIGHVMETQFGADSDVTKKLNEALANIFLRSLPEMHALRREAARKGIEGANPDMLRAFASTGQSSAFYNSRLQYATDLADTMFRMKQEAKGNIDLQHIHREMEQRMALDMKFTDTPVQDALSGASWVYHLGMSPSNVLINATQPWMVTGPILAAKHGLMKATSALTAASADAIGMVKDARMKGDKFDMWSGINETSLPKQSERLMMRNLMERGIVDEGLQHDNAMIAEDSNRKMAKFNRVMGWANQQVELVNRASTALAAYRLGIADGMTHEEATEHAYNTVVSTQFDYSTEGTARIMREGGGVPLAKLVFQFRKYQQAMLYLLATNAKKAFAGDKEAMAAVGYLFTTSGLAAGITGMPLAGVAFALANAFRDPDDPEGDAETAFRNGLVRITGDKKIADVFTKGIPAAWGWDVSARIGLGDVASPFGQYTKFDGKTGQDQVNKIAGALAGPVGGMAANMYDGIVRFNEGDWAKGAEKMLPKAGADLIKSGRYAVEGMTDGKGVPTGTKLDALDIASRAMGMTTMAESDYYEGTKAVKNTEAAINAREASVAKQFEEGLRGGDMSAARNAIAKFNADHPENPITGKKEQEWRKAVREEGKNRQDGSGVKLGTKKQAAYNHLAAFAERQ